jgi:hypothetical protein
MDNEVNINHDKEYHFLQEHIILYEGTKLSPPRIRVFEGENNASQKLGR